jgi:membrane protein
LTPVMTYVAARGRPWRRWALAVYSEVRQTVVLSGYALWRAAAGIANSDDLTHAASIGYYSLLSLFPFLLLAISVLGTMTANEDARQATLAFLLQYFPTRFEFVTGQLDLLHERRTGMGIASALFLIWASLGVFSAVSSAVNHAWGVEKQRSFLKHRLVSFLMLVAASLLLLLTLLMISAGQVVEALWFAHVVERYPALESLRSLVVRWISTFTLVVGVGLVFYFIPNAKVRFRDVWVGAILTGLLWRGAFEGFSWYLRDLSRFSVHGSIAAVVAFLFWIYVSAVILLYGVEFTAAYSRMRRRRPEEVPAAPTPRA